VTVHSLLSDEVNCEEPHKTS